VTFNVNTPSIKISVLDSYLTNNPSLTTTTAGYLMSIKSVDGNALAFTLLLDSGAIFSNLPIEAIRCDRYSFPVTNNEVYTTKQLQPYSCLDGDIQIVEYSLLRHSDMLVKVAGQDVEAKYLFTVDYNGTSLADDPEQRKTHNIVQLRNNQVAAMPNNKCLVVNKTHRRVK
jgi:hypothetical protein